MDGEIVAIIGIGCGTGIVWMFFETVKAALTGRNHKKQDELVTEIRALRQEVNILRQQNNDLILSLDSSPPRIEPHRPIAADTEQRVGLR